MSYKRKRAPVILTSYSVVDDVEKFITATLRDLEPALAGKAWLAGNRSVRELTERLEQVGVVVRVVQQ